MKVVIHPSAVRGTIAAPPSKSAMQRACAAALVTGGVTHLKNPGISNDDKAALDIIQQFGAVVTKQANEIVVNSRGSFLFNNTANENIEINCGESGLSIRMFTPIAALCKQPVGIVGSGSLAKRPMDFFDKILPELGVNIQSQNGHIPLQVQGPLKPANITVDGSLSSQFLTGLLMAYSAANASDVTIEVINLKSSPYIDLTLSVIQKFSLKIPVNKNYRYFYFPPNNASENKESHMSYTVEGDWSGGSFLLVAGAINGFIHVKGLDINSTQADKKILEALKDCSSIINIANDKIVVQSTSLTAFVFDATDCPDLFPPLVALAAYCNGKTTIKGTSRLTHKESNRATTLQEQFGQLGVEILLQDDEMIIHGNGIVSGGSVSSCHDHRIAMACAVAGLAAKAPVIIEDAEAINKSYPEFYKHLQQLGVSLEIDNS